MRKFYGKHPIFKQFLILALMLAAPLMFSALPAEGRSNATPWSNEMTFQNLVYGSSTTTDVQQILGGPPDTVVRSEQMYPLLENYYYYDDAKTGAATVFVFENNFLVGLHFKSAENQYMDLTYFLPSNGDRTRNMQSFGAGYNGYYPYFPLYGF